MRLQVVTSALTLLATVHGSWLAAQTAPGQLGMPVPANDQRAGLQAASRATWHGRVLTALGGGLLGAGVGFFASQVVTGDWDVERGVREVDRQAWASVGGSIGFAVGFSFPLRGRAETVRPVSTTPARSLVTARELARSGITTAHDAVRLLRPQWLRDPGVHVIGEQQCPERWTDVPACPDRRLVVYLDDSRLGGVETLKEISAQTIRSIQFLDGAAATYRWGAGHSHGAILIITAGASPDRAGR
ncbi:MAG: hypothetical protein ACREMA_09950 [Longimicrobiales bacterium]